eukprot:3968363-Alexandrium_andersonii.AAC.1
MFPQAGVPVPVALALRSHEWNWCRLLDNLIYLKQHIACRPPELRRDAPAAFLLPPGAQAREADATSQGSRCRKCCLADPPSLM